MSTVTEIHKKIKQKRFAPFYMIYGPEEWIIEETVELIISTALTDKEKEFNLSVYDMKETSIEVALEDAETIPFIGEKRVVLIKNPVFFTGQKENHKIEHNVKRLETFLESPSPEAIVVFIGDYEKLDERKKIVKLLKKNGEMLKAIPMDEKEILTWIEKRVQASNKKIEKEAIVLLLQLVGPQLMLIAHEIEKLLLYIGEDQIITSAIVQQLVPRTLEQNIFALIDMIVKRKTEEAFLFFYDLIEQKEEPIKILSLLSTQFRLIYQVKALYKQGYGQNQASRILKVHPFRVKLAGKQAEQFTESELYHIVKELAEMDYQMKTGKMDKKLLLELFILKLHRKT